MKFDLTVESREGGGKGPARQLRRAGRVPAVLYGQGECLLLSVKPDELVKILRSQAGSTALISLTINGAKSKAKRIALLREFQVDPITSSVLHADFFEVAMDKPIRVKVRFEQRHQRRSEIGANSPYFTQRFEAALLHVVATCLFGAPEQVLLQCVQRVDHAMFQKGR